MGRIVLLVKCTFRSPAYIPRQIPRRKLCAEYNPCPENVRVAGCAQGFAHEWMSIHQVLARKAGSAVNPIPLTREYLYTR